MNLCKCGCGEEIDDHYYYMNGNKIKPQYKKGHNSFNIWKGKKFSDKHKLAISKARTGSIISEEIRKKIGKANTGKVRSEETKQKISKIKIDLYAGGYISPLKGKHLSEEAKENLRQINLGKHHTQETIEKLRHINLGKKVSPETRKKISIAGKGRKASNETKEKLRLVNLGKKASLETRKKMSLARLGKHMPKETKNKISITLSKLWQTSNHRKKMIPIVIKNTKNKRYKNTKIELKIGKFLDELNIKYETNYFINDIKNFYGCDIYIPETKIVIECDGDYFHKYPKGNPIDHIRNQELKDAGYKVLRLWEHEINNMSSKEELSERLNNIF